MTAPSLRGLLISICIVFILVETQAQNFGPPQSLARTSNQNQYTNGDNYDFNYNSQQHHQSPSNRRYSIPDSPVAHQPPSKVPIMNSGEEGQEGAQDYDGNPSDSNRQTSGSSLKLTSTLPPQGFTEDTTPPAPLTTESPEQVFESRLRALQKQVNDWLAQMEQKQKEAFLNLTRKVDDRHFRINAAITKSFEDKLNKEKVEPCQKSIRAIDTLLDKMSLEISSISSSQNMGLDSQKGSKSKSPTTRRPQPQMDPSTILNYLKNLEKRLHAMDDEIYTEPSDSCSQPVTDKCADLLSQVTRIRQQEKQRHRDVVVSRAIQGINATRYTAVNLDLDQLVEDEGLDSQLNLALQEIINKTLILGKSSDLETFDKILNFIKALKSTSMKPAMQFLVDAMKNCPKKVDSVQFLRLAYEAKTAFGMEFKSQFNSNFQQLIWGGTQCIRNKYTTQYLVSNRTLIQRGRHLRNETQENPTRLPLYTTPIVLNAKGQVDNKKGKNEYCGWEFYPVLDTTGATFSFIIRQQIRSDWDWNMNVEGSATYVSPATVNPHFMWQVLPMEQGQIFTIQTLNPSILSTQVNGTTTNFLCSLKGGRDRRDVAIQNFDKYCSWILENPFE